MSLAYTLLGVIDAGSTASPSISVTIPAGCTKLTVTYRNSGGRTITSATFGAAALSLLGANGTHASEKCETWQLDNPTPGTDTLTLNQSGVGSCTGEVLAWTGSATGPGSVGAVATAPSAATTLNIASALGEIPILVLCASSGSPNTITDTSSPPLTLIDKRLSASGLVLGGSFSGIGEADGTVATAFTIANGGGVKIALGFSIKPATAVTATDIAKQAGDNQAAQVGTAVGTALQVLVTGAGATPVAGYSVTFVVASGGGSLGGSGTVVTDASGIATCPAWMLGPAAGLNTITVTDAALAGSPLTFTAMGTTASGGASGRRLVNGSLIQPTGRS